MPRKINVHSESGHLFLYSSFDEKLNLLNNWRAVMKNSVTAFSRNNFNLLVKTFFERNGQFDNILLIFNHYHRFIIFICNKTICCHNEHISSFPDQFEIIFKIHRYGHHLMVKPHFRNLINQFVLLTAMTTSHH